LQLLVSFYKLIRICSGGFVGGKEYNRCYNRYSKNINRASYQEKKIIWEAQPKSFIVTTHTVVVHTKHAGVRVTAGLAHTFSNLNEFKLKGLTYKMQISSSTTTLVLVVSQSEFI